jgi:hypothetical protein
MTNDALKLQHERFSLTFIENRIVFEGDMDDKNLDEILEQFFEKIIDQAKGNLIIDIRNLYFINSTGINKIIRFIIKCRLTCPITFHIDKTRIWQKKCVKTIKTIDKEHIAVIEE